MRTYERERFLKGSTSVVPTVPLGQIEKKDEMPLRTDES